MNITKCRACERPIGFIKTKAGKTVPVDAESVNFLPDPTGKELFVLVDGSPTARLMCVVGKGTKYADKPDFETNYALASALTENLRHIEKRLARDVRVKTGRYNQHVGELNLLIEVGHNANTLEQALHAVPSLAESLALTLAGMEAAKPVEQEKEPSNFCQLLVPGRAGIDKE